MLGSVVLDLAIGMAFVFLLLSLIASVVQEMLATFMQLRAANLERALRSLFSGDSLGAGEDLVERIYDHGLVRGLYRDPERDLKQARAASDLAVAQNAIDKANRELAAADAALKSKKPADSGFEEAKADFETKKKDASKAARQYKIAATSAKRSWSGKAFLDPIRLALRKWIGIHPEKPITSASSPLLLPSYIPSGTFAQTLIDIMNPAKVDAGQAMDAITQTLRDVQTRTPDNKACEALLTLAIRAEGRLDTFQRDLESWYNAAMDRASGWYKRYTQGILLGIGLVLAVTFNVDTIRVARALWTDKDVRQGMVNAASEYTKQHPNLSAQDAAAGSDKKVFSEADLQKQLQASADQFNKVATTNLLPVGWKDPEVWTRRRYNLFHHFGASVGHGLDWLTYSYTWQLMLGWLMTAIAISMGAPFWFDTLNKFMVVRGTVKPAEKSAPEGSKDRAATPAAPVKPAPAHDGRAN